MSKIKLVRKLGQKKYRNELKLFVAEGLRLCEEVPPAQIEFGFYTREFLSEARGRILVERLKNLEEISAATLEKISAEPSNKTTAQSKAAAVRKIVPTLPGSCTPSNATIIFFVAISSSVENFCLTTNKIPCGV